jgi:hypothetical protein
VRVVTAAQATREEGRNDQEDDERYRVAHIGTTGGRLAISSFDP